MEEKTSEFPYDYMNLLDEKEASCCSEETWVYKRDMIICWIIISILIGTSFDKKYNWLFE